MKAAPANVHVQDHGFYITDRDADMPFESMDYSTGLAGTLESAAMIYAGIDRGYVTVSAQPADHAPELNTDEQWANLAAWDDIVEFTLFAPNGALTVEQLEYGPFDARPELPVLSPSGKGHYRLRVYANGRDRHYDRVVEQSGERYHIVAWPAPPTAPLVIKASSWCGYSLRLAALQSPRRTKPTPPTPEEQAEAERQAMLRRNLLGM